MTSPRNLAALAATVALTLIPAAAAPAASPHLSLKAEHVGTLNATVLAAPNGRTLYRLSPETAKHLLCTSSACTSIWRPLTVRSKKTVVHLPSGLAGHARLLRRGHAYQVMLGSHPLYTYTGDSRKGQAAGEGIATFGGTWHTLTVSKDAAAPAPPPSTPPAYPPYY